MRVDLLNGVWFDIDTLCTMPGRGCVMRLKIRNLIWHTWTHILHHFTTSPVQCLLFHLASFHRWPYGRGLRCFLLGLRHPHPLHVSFPPLLPILAIQAHLQSPSHPGCEHDAARFVSTTRLRTDLRVANWVIMSAANSVEPTSLYRRSRILNVLSSARLVEYLDTP